MPLNFLMIAHLAEGRKVLRGLLQGEDTKIMVDMTKKYGDNTIAQEDINFCYNNFGQMPTCKK